MKIAFLFLTDTDPNISHVWDAYLQGHEHQYSIYIHPQRPALCKWHPDRIIAALQPTAYGFVTRAYRALVSAAMTDPQNIKFVFVSESCVPIVPFDQMYAALCANPAESFVKRMRITKYDKGARLDSVPGLIAAVGSKNIIKHYSRTCLSRPHAQKLLTDPRVLWFDVMFVGDEFFMSGIQPVKNMKDAAITEDDWDDTRDKLKIIRDKLAAVEPGSKRAAELNAEFDDTASHPRLIHTLTERDKQRIRASPSFFYRKFAKGSNIDIFLREIGVI